MAAESDSDSPASRIQLSDGILPVRPQNAAVVSRSYEKDLKEPRDYDLDQEEKARKIAHDDLGAQKKQVQDIQNTAGALAV